MTKITVGIPAYKTRHLVQAISSVLAQTFTDFELLISDDTPDGSAGEIVSRFQDPRIRLIEGPRQGLVANSVNIWDNTSTDLLKYLHDDDLLFPDALEELSGLLEKDPRFTFATSRRVVVDEYGREIRRPMTYLTDSWMWFEPSQLAGHIARSLSNAMGEPSNFLIRRSAFEDSSCLSRLAGLPITRLIDVAFVLNSAQRGPCVATGKYLSAFREHADQVSAQIKAPDFSMSLLEWEVCLRAAVQLGLAPPQVALDGSSKLEGLYRPFAGVYPEVHHFLQQLPALKDLLGAGARDVLTPQFRADLQRADATVKARVQQAPPQAQPESVTERPDRIRARVELLSRRGARGWAWIPDAPEQPVCVEAVVGDRVVGHAVANVHRPDLAAWNIGTTHRGFEINFYEPILGGEAPRFRFFAQEEWLAGEFRLPPVEGGMVVQREGTEAPLLEHARFTAPGPLFEHLAWTRRDDMPRRLDGPAPLLVAFYLPQFHSIPENDRNWGYGFTEWRQLPRGMSRFPGHYQPRTPRDLGFYDLLSEDILKKQCQIAEAAGIGAFAFYYYWFNRKRVLERPVEIFLNSDVQMPFFIIWANENWTRGWDGSEEEILLKQDYNEEDEDALLADLARHMRHPRHVRLEGRPLFVIYNPDHIPDTARTLARWRQKWADDHGLRPLIYMAQTFQREDPRPYGLDGALEFPPHKLGSRIQPRDVVDAFSREFGSRVMAYDGLAQVSLAEPPAAFPLIKTIIPSWDNEARRPNRGVLFEGSTPQKYQSWLQALIERAMDQPVHGAPIVAINAWNEWAEGAYLEPDVHFGAAYLNATARALNAAVEKRNSAFKPEAPPRPALQKARERKRIVLHIGQHKTGTTSIQAALTDLRGELAKAGMLYPQAGCPDWADLAHHLLPWSVITRPEARPTLRGRRAEFQAGDEDRLWDALHEEIAASAADTVLISSEEFDVLDAAEIASLKSRLQRYDVTPVLFARRPSAAVESNYRTEVIHLAYARGIRDLVREGRARTGLVGLVDDWRKVAANGEMIILSYDDPEIRRDAVRGFLKILDLEKLADLSGPRPRLNQGAPAFVCEAARYLRELAVGDEELSEWVKQIQDGKLLQDASERYTCLPPDLGAELDAAYALDIRRLADDPVTAAMLRGRFDTSGYKPRGELVGSPTAAFLALGREFARRSDLVRG